MKAVGWKFAKNDLIDCNVSVNDETKIRISSI